ncbi:hypothetical protein JG687_00009749 [Phytophthora cactorum]|uniref:Uncharacterized protein n=1 Tax=Phytophthora cactorum TaxID=29920 RepID=A0A8T1U8X7_9STRA|nr:hypothetical protein JG687_00009749 [Phytophthora cactorum]
MEVLQSHFTILTHGLLTFEIIWLWNFVVLWVPFNYLTEIVITTVMSNVNGVHMCGVIASSHIPSRRTGDFLLVQVCSRRMLGSVLTERLASNTIRSEHQMRHSRVRKVIQYLKQLAKESGALSDCCKWGICTRTICNVFYIVFVKILSQLYTATPKRAEDLS